MASGVLAQATGAELDGAQARKVSCLRALERKVLWLATWMIHHANRVRPNRDGLKVGGHQASSASLVTLMTALYFDVLRPQDRVAVKPHASPVLHAIQYLLGREGRDKLEAFRSFGGAQSYPSRTKDDGVDFSTGSEGLGLGITIFAALMQEYLHAQQLLPAGRPMGRMIALGGDAELDEGAVYEALLEGWKQDVRNLWWVVDYNRQSLDTVIKDRLSEQIEHLFGTMGWKVVILKYGKQLQAVFERRHGDALRAWLDDCPNLLYSTLVYKGGGAWRERLRHDLGELSGIRELLDEHDDDALHRLLTNLAGHDMETVLEAFHAADDESPTCFIAYTIKGYGLPIAGHKDNHAALLTGEQIEALRCSMDVPPGEEWEHFSGLDVPANEMARFVAAAPLATDPRQRTPPAPRIAVPSSLTMPRTARTSTQEGFGRLLRQLAIGRTELADHIVTTSPDVTVSTNLGGWVNGRGVFGARARTDLLDAGMSSGQKWAVSPRGQHIELGIAESNLFLLLAALGLSGPIFGPRLIPIGTVYDCFVSRGLDVLNYGCYQDARFLLVATPSGLTLAPEGGMHQSVHTPLIGMGQPGLTAFEPAFVDELATILRWSFEHLQDDGGGSVYLRLSTRPIVQPERELTAEQRADIIEGGYWLVPPSPSAELALVCCGSVTPEAMAAHELLREDIPGCGLLLVTSPDRLYAAWRAHCQPQRERNSSSHIEQILSAVGPHATLVTAIDGHPATLSWLGSVRGQRVVPLGVDRFGQSGDIPDLYREYQLDVDAFVAAAARACLNRRAT